MVHMTNGQQLISNTTSNVVFDAVDEIIGSDIGINTETGIIDVSPTLTYTLSAIGSIDVLPTDVTYQWYNVTAEEFLGQSAVVGTPVTATFSPDVLSDIALVVITSPNEFIMPTHIYDVHASIQIIDSPAV